MIGANKDEALMMSLGLHLDEDRFEDFSSRWKQELCPLIVFHRWAELKDQLNYGEVLFTLDSAPTTSLARQQSAATAFYMLYIQLKCLIHSYL